MAENKSHLFGFHYSEPSGDFPQTVGLQCPRLRTLINKAPPLEDGLGGVGAEILERAEAGQLGVTVGGCQGCTLPLGEEARLPSGWPGRNLLLPPQDAVWVCGMATVMGPFPHVPLVSAGCEDPTFRPCSFALELKWKCL